ncbi:hypothetical protein CDAR_320331 [Caerostris darwini]|uniref:Secreted protein n=1 Tax=Caerostris darwini TaxID=1538125 RepID=A0AAV4PGL3_9ARAC|nr:hypothetical protein CDAR_320331 [Caerostris darwini]
MVNLLALWPIVIGEVFCSFGDATGKEVVTSFLGFFPARLGTVRKRACDFLLGFFPARLGTVRKRGCDFLFGFFSCSLGDCTEKSLVRVLLTSFWGFFSARLGTARKRGCNRSGFGVYQTRKYPAILKKLSLKSTRFLRAETKIRRTQQSAGGEILKILVTMGEEKKKDRRMEER